VIAPDIANLGGRAVNEHEPQPEARLFPTRHKAKIGSYLSWPTGAQCISRALAATVQANWIELSFHTHWPAYPRGRWPTRFMVINVAYSRQRNMHVTGHAAEPAWAIYIYPVPRELRATIRSALDTVGFLQISVWLKAHEQLHGREGRVAFSLFWNADANALETEESGKAVPNVIHDCVAQALTNK
jgi:hypothetical protein